METMDNNHSTSFPAFVWTGKQTIDAFASIPMDFSPFEDVLSSAKTLFAVITNVEVNSISFLSDLFETSKDLNGHIIICLPKGCLTNQPNLKLLTDLEKQYISRINIKIFLLNSREDILSSIFLINTFDDKTVLSLGDFLRDTSYSNKNNNNIKRNNLVFTPQNELAEVIYKWYDYLWLDQTVPLDEFILNEFPIVFSSTTNKNNENMSSKEQINIRNNINNSVETTVETIKNTAKTSLIAPTKFLNVPRLDPFALKIAKIYEQGEIVTLDRKNRFPPLEIPIKAEWLGIKGSEKIGNLTQEIKYRILAIDENLLKQIEQKKNILRELVHNFTFSMGESLRWIPLKAKPLFEQELDRVNKEVKDFIQTVLGNNVSEYLDKRKNKIEEDARRIQSNFINKTKENSTYPTSKKDKLPQLNLFMEEDSSQQTLFREGKENQSNLVIEKVYIEKILNEITRRLTKVKECNFIPSISYNKISFNYSESKWSSPWLQASRFLTSIAEFSRKGTYEVFLKHTPSIDYKQYIQAMDVCDDSLIRLLGNDNFSYVQNESLTRLQRIMETEEIYSTEGERLCNKCKDLFDLMYYF